VLGFFVATNVATFLYGVLHLRESRLVMSTTFSCRRGDDCNQSSSFVWNLSKLTWRCILGVLQNLP